MRNKMTADQLAKLKSQSERANALRGLALTALGDNATSVEQRKAQSELEHAVGKRKANQLKEDELRRAGAKAKGLGRFFG